LENWFLVRQFSKKLFLSGSQKPEPQFQPWFLLSFRSVPTKSTAGSPVSSVFCQFPTSPRAGNELTKTNSRTSVSQDPKKAEPLPWLRPLVLLRVWVDSTPAASRGPAAVASRLFSDGPPKKKIEMLKKKK